MSGRRDGTWILRRSSPDPAVPTMGGPEVGFRREAAEESLPNAAANRETAGKLRAEELESEDGNDCEMKQEAQREREQPR